MLEPKRLFQFRGEFPDGLHDFRRLFRHGRHHAFGEVRLVLDDFQTGNDKREIIIQVMPKVSQLLVQLGYLLDCQGHGLPG